MMFITHIAFGLLLGLLILKHISLPVNQHIFLIVLCLASFFPDLDSATSFIGKKFRIVSLFFKHRGAIHSITIMIVTSIIFFLISRNPYYTIAFILGFSAHLLLDSITPKGVAFFWPNKVRMRGRFRTTGLTDILLFVILVALDALLLLYKKFRLPLDSLNKALQASLQKSKTLLRSQKSCGFLIPLGKSEGTWSE
jgi:inner membrane protein